MLDDNADSPPPWSSPPSDLGSEECGWCHRAIYRPAVPCSVRPVGGLAAMPTLPGQGQRCQWELRTRRDVASDGSYPPGTADR